MFAKLWHKLRASEEEHERQKDEAAIEEFALEHEEHEHAKGEEAHISVSPTGTEFPPS